MSKIFKTIAGMCAITFSVLMLTGIASADVLCVKGQSVLLIKGTNKCIKGTKALNASKLGLIGEAGPQGPVGATGPQGATGPTSTAISDWQSKGLLSAFTGPIDTSLCDYRVKFGTDTAGYYSLSDFQYFDFSDVDFDSKPFNARQTDLYSNWKSAKFTDGSLTPALVNLMIADSQDRVDFNSFATSATGTRILITVTRVVPGNYQPPSISGPTATIVLYNDSETQSFPLVAEQITLESRCSTTPAQQIP